MQFTIIAVGKLKEKYLVQASQEYLKRLRPMARVKVVEVKDEPLPQPGSASAEPSKETEAHRIISAIPANTVVFALDPEGEEYSSPELAQKLADYALRGHSGFTFIIGGGAGLAGSILNQCDERLSFSHLTFPHQLFRVMLLEQLYRVMKINRNEPYHR